VVIALKDMMRWCHVMRQGSHVHLPIPLVILDLMRASVGTQCTPKTKIHISMLAKPEAVTVSYITNSMYPL